MMFDKERILWNMVEKVLLYFAPKKKYDPRIL